MFAKLKQKILAKFRYLQAQAQRLNEMMLDKGSAVHPSAIITGSRLKGKIEVKDHASVANSEISGDVSIGPNAVITGATLNGKIRIGEHSKLFPGSLLYGNIDIGKYTSINGPNTDLTSAIHAITIGSFCSIARNVTFQEYNHDFRRMTSYFLNRNVEKKPMTEDVISKGGISIGNDVWIGTHAVILSGATIGTGAVIASNSVVTGLIPPYAIAAGSPARVLKYRFDEPTIAQLLKSEWWTKPEKEIIELYRTFGIKEHQS